MKPPRLRSGPPIPLVAFACVIGFLPALYCVIYLAGGAGKTFHEEPLWILAALVPAFLFRRLAIPEPEHRRLRVRWGFWIPGLFVLPIFWRRYALGNVDAVVLLRETRGGGKNPTTVYAVRLGGALLGDRMAYREGRRMGEKAAEALGLPLTDAADGTPVTRPAGSLSKTVSQRLRDGEIRVPDVCRPEWSDLVVKESERGVDLVRPPLMNFKAFWPTLIFYALVNGVLAFEVRQGGPTPRGAEIALGVIWSIVGGVSVLAVLVSLDEATVRWRIRLQKGRVVLSRRSWVSRRSRSMSLGELEEVDLTEGIRLRGDRGQFVFGNDLDREEREWVHAELLRRLREA